AGERVDSFLFQPALKDLVLVIRQAVHRLGIDGVVRLSLGKEDSPAGKKRVSAGDPRLAVKVAVVVSPRAERAERAGTVAGSLEAAGEEVVDALSPCCGVDLVAACEDAVEVEDAGSDFRGEPEGPHGRAGSGEPVVELDALLTCNSREEAIRGDTLLGK